MHELESRKDSARNLAALLCCNLALCRPLCALPVENFGFRPKPILEFESITHSALLINLKSTESDLLLQVDGNIACWFRPFLLAFHKFSSPENLSLGRSND